MIQEGQSTVGVVQHRKIVPVLLLSLVVIGAWTAFDVWVDMLIGLFPDKISGIALIRTSLTVISWIVGGWLVSKLFSIYFWRGLIERQNQRPVPKLMIDILNAVIVAATSAGILIMALGMSPAVVGVMFGGAIVLISLFLKRPMDDLFAGLSLHMDPAVNLGDLISLLDGQTGRVDEITWRSTRLLTQDGNAVIVPNRLIADSTLTNYSSPAPFKQIEFTATLDFSVPIDRSLRVFEAALNAAVGKGVIVAEPVPQAFVDGPGVYGITYRARFFYDFQKTSEEKTRTAVMRHIMTHLTSSGLEFALPQENLFLGRVSTRQMDWMRTADHKALLGNCAMFSELHDDELMLLAEGIKVHRFNQGENLIRQGETDTSMFGLAEGLLEVSVKPDGEGEAVKVARIEPGDFFGEMSLLAGEPRSATISTLVDSVVFEITRDNILAVLEQRPEIGETLSRLVAKRQVETSGIVETANNREKEEAISINAMSLLKRMASIFGSALTRINPTF